ncbi:MAG: ABC transporter ATP-binding protein [Cytophagales bacterium]|nr:ABC transporter ATP-binding protein [Cytophagales bacterium]
MGAEKTVIKAENLSKVYRLGEIGFGTLKEDISRLWNSIWGKKQNYFQVGNVNHRGSSFDGDRYVQTLKNLSFEVYKGDTVGLLGKNGAGKSTLLKILSNITRPTHGKAYLQGAVSSLLEVGTGFYSELTGAENVELSGVILGMKRSQIRRQFDSIVDFSGIGRFINTPVKRYSSGMSLRLAFSVAAFLESDILLMDEILAVGDHEFRKRALNRMLEVSRSGKTIIYVSHTMTNIRYLCQKGLLLEGGHMKHFGDVRQTIQEYGEQGDEVSAILELPLPNEHEKSTGYVKTIVTTNLDEEPTSIFQLGSSWQVHVLFVLNRDAPDFRAELSIMASSSGVIVNRSESGIISKVKAGSYIMVFENRDISLGAGAYKLSITLSSGMEIFEILPECTSMHISDIAPEDALQTLHPDTLILNPLRFNLKEGNKEYLPGKGIA